MIHNETPDIKERYSYDSILEMLGGTEYFSENQISFIFHSVNGLEEQAEYYLQEVKKEQAIIQKEFDKMLKLKEEAEQMDDSK